MKQLTYTATIKAGKQKVWETMLHPTSYKEWVNAAWPGSFFEGKWEEGESLKFMTADRSGTLATLVEHRPYDYSLASHAAVLNAGGTEDLDSDIAKSWIGTTECYTFTEQKGVTVLSVVLTIYPQWEKMFNDGWPKALAKLKEICERKDPGI
jgi:hypothetical protein